MNRLTNKKTLKEILAAYDRQIRKDMGFWIKYRPSRWGDLLPEKFIRPLLTFIKTKGGKKFVLILTFSFKLDVCWSYTNFKFYLVKYFQDLVDSLFYSIGLLDISNFFCLFKGARSGVF